MPLIRIKKVPFLTKWDPAWDKIILKARKKYIRRNGNVNWKEAEAVGALKGIPVIFTRQDLSHRLSFITRSKYNEDYQIEHRKRSIEYNKTYFSKSIMNREELFRGLPMEIKLAHGYKPRNNPEWTPARIELLKTLVLWHRRSEKSINWDSLMSDPRARRLPPYSKAHIRSYYWSLVSREDPEVIAKRRADALDYKYRNLKKYYKSQKKRKELIRSVVNDVLHEKIKEVR
jgi:hypothetical protein